MTMRMNQIVVVTLILGTGFMQNVYSAAPAGVDSAELGRVCAEGKRLTDIVQYTQGNLHYLLGVPSEIRALSSHEYPGVIAQIEQWRLQVLPLRSRCSDEQRKILMKTAIPAWQAHRWLKDSVK